MTIQRVFAASIPHLHAGDRKIGRQDRPYLLAEIPDSPRLAALTLRRPSVDVEAWFDTSPYCRQELIRPISPWLVEPNRFRACP